MTSLALAFQERDTARRLLIVLAATVLIPIVIFGGISINTAVALVATVLVFTLWFVNRSAGVLAGVFFYLVKAVFVRVAFGLDQAFGTANNQDLLGMAPTITLVVLILCNLFADYSSGISIAPDRPRKLALALVALAMASIFFPTNTILNGLGGFQRNILPNMMIMFLAASVWDKLEFRISLVKLFLILGVVSCLYGIGQWIEGIYPWEKAWMMDRFLTQGDHGLMTVGLRGLEFRIFSVFFSYMDFFFSNVIIFALVFTYKHELSPGWRFLRIVYFMLWAVMLGLSVERMPMLMTLAVVIVANYLRRSKQRRRTLLKRYLAVGVGLYLVLLSATPILKLTGADTLSRLSELANPFDAPSIQDRSDRIWGPVLEIIASHPWGVGIGYGSQTRASDDAEATGMWIPPHNELLQKVLETGFIGGILYLLLQISMFRAALTRRSGRRGANNLILAFAGITVAFWLCGMVNLPFSGASGLLYWALAGIMLTQGRAESTPEAGTVS